MAGLGQISGFNYPQPQNEKPIVGRQDLENYWGWLNRGGGLQGLGQVGQSLFGPQGRQTTRDIVRGADGPVQPFGLGMGGPDALMGQAMDFLNPMAKVGGLLGMVAKSGPKTASPLQSIIDKWEGSGLKIDAYSGKPNTDLLNLSRIEVPKNQRGQGIGSQAMDDLINFANTNKKTITLTPDISFGGTSVGRLKRFYKQHGFVENKGRNKDFTISESMYRLPD